jgi:hypothetical protein
LPGTVWVDERRGEIAVNLIELLPQHVKTETAEGSRPFRFSPGYWTTLPKRTKPWLIALFIAALTAALVWFS